MYPLGDVRKGTVIILQEATSDQQKESTPVIPVKTRRLSIIILLILLALITTCAGIYFLLKKNKPVEKSIAILPFDNLSSDKENQYFADGIVEDLLNRISKIEGLKVISRTSSELFRSKGNKSIPEIAHILGVSYILEGTVQRESDNIRINIQLIDARKDEHILSQQYDRYISEVFKIQSEIAGQIASELSLALTDQQLNALTQDQTKNLKAFEYKQLGRQYLNKRTKEDILNSIKYFRLAIKEDPDYALAYAELADSYFILSYYGYIERQTGRDSAVYLAQKALEMDNNLGEAHTVLAVIYDTYDWEFEAATEEFNKAIRTGPNHSTAYQYYSELLCTEGRLREAREIMNKAIQLDPYSYVIRWASSYLYYKEENFQKALSENQICQALVKDHSATYLLGYRIYLKLGNEPSALESYKKLGKFSGKWTPEQADSVYRIGGFKGLFRWQLNIEKGYDGHQDRDKAIYYAMLGEDEKALDILESIVDEDWLDPFWTSDLEFKNLRSHPRFIAIRKKMGLSPL